MQRICQTALSPQEYHDQQARSRPTSIRPCSTERKTFLPADHPLWKTFRAPTQAEEAAGVYEQTAAIGFKLNWEIRAEISLLIKEGNWRSAFHFPYSSQDAIEWIR
jgi:hypothetical protein